MKLEELRDLLDQTGWIIVERYLDDIMSLHSLRHWNGKPLLLRMFTTENKEVVEFVVEVGDERVVSRRITSSQMERFRGFGANWLAWRLSEDLKRELDKEDQPQPQPTEFIGEKDDTLYSTYDPVAGF